jgi:hypothetical protein
LRRTRTIAVVADKDCDTVYPRNQSSHIFSLFGKTKSVTPNLPLVDLTIVLPNELELLHTIAAKELKLVFLGKLRIFVGLKHRDLLCPAARGIVLLIGLVCEVLIKYNSRQT